MYLEFIARSEIQFKLGCQKNINSKEYKNNNNKNNLQAKFWKEKRKIRLRLSTPCEENRKRKSKTKTGQCRYNIHTPNGWFS